MIRRCANPDCQFDLTATHAVCSDPHCVRTLEGCRCGTYYGLLPSGSAVPFDTRPSPTATGNIAWLCCSCAAQYRLVSLAGGDVVLEVEPVSYEFVGRFEFDRLQELTIGSLIH